MKFDALIEVYANAIKNGNRTIDDVPTILKEEIKEKIASSNHIADKG